MSLVLEGYGYNSLIITDGLGSSVIPSFIPIFIEIEHTLSEIIETIPGPLEPSVVLNLLKTGQFLVEIKNEIPIISGMFRIDNPESVIIKVFPDSAGILSTTGIEIPGLWGYLFNGKPGIIYSRDEFGIDVKSNLIKLKPGITSGEIFTPSMIKTEVI